MSAQDFTLASAINPSISLSNELIVNRIGLFLEYGQKVTLECHDWTGLTEFVFQQAVRFHSLKVLRVVIEEAFFDKVQNKLAWISHFSNSELTKITSSNGMSVSPDLQGLKFWLNRSEYNNSDKEKATFASNVKKLERITGDRKTEDLSSDDRTQNTGGISPLYEGSRVFHNDAAQDVAQDDCDRASQGENSNSNIVLEPSTAIREQFRADLRSAMEASSNVSTPPPMVTPYSSSTQRASGAANSLPTGRPSQTLPAESSFAFSTRLPLLIPIPSIDPTLLAAVVR